MYMSSTLSFDEKLRNYARIGLVNLGYDQKIRPLYVESFQLEDHGNFIPMLAREAYALGADIVDVHYDYPELEREQFLGAPEEKKLYVAFHVTCRAKEIVDRGGARLALNGNGEFGVFDDLDPKYPVGYKGAKFKANEPLTTRRMKMLQPWSILDVPTTSWANKLGMTVENLWEFLFHITGADREDGPAYAVSVSDMLHKRCDLLNALHMDTLHFVGNGTDFKVGLSKKARWLGGRKQGEDGVWFEPNWPSFEVFTTPDWRRTEGKVRITLPTCIHGPIADGISVRFSEGRIVDFSAEKGSDVFKSLIGHDKGSSMLGEIALVGLDSPLSKYKEPHFCIMLDENKRCHMAVGKAYAACLEGGTTMSKEELDELGCNTLTDEIHHDMMISDETTSVFALDAEGKKSTQLIKDGHWVSEFK
ncbi:hypothetical protein A2673_03950 [Candidatus Kaiserbacteria bacterium RIFCSPHIGHO2_01_FULL_50_13]|uniref:Peptidase M29 n=1 Tax=Candidatus Kaiserbacteria bacterium RIFCSPLOWO2_01_FULL_50_24 TaxID=1798507 RepID=A0A1F6EII5_9BACT|nr:MAG: hypothetical protein A2673_03950 [Candidatus Kaiserbacteria bacterium RIFCSPHIGHO2_01_FULL_50_13]OGG73466.1 MAG: hypothetical protein A3A34_01225 [Candidatus Kaiserbacteria bacterium RIFCSPLOWO2_01_FULL_50_24]OGG80868.1 MAG: hypothetical protein A3H74_02515 [Candidatus Kaiserbacteria bacterium RIFCSPLOWO2_02_FULL_51_13]